MTQDRKSGAAANAYGHETAPKIAAALGASMTSTMSNEASYNGQRVVIKCAGKNTTSVGVTHEMLERLDLVLAAFQHKDGSYDVYSLSPEEYRTQMRESRSSGAEGRIGLVSKTVFANCGKRIKIVRMA